MQYEKPPGYNISVPVFQPIAPHTYFDNRLPQMATPDAGNLIRPLAEGIATAIMAKPKLDAQRQQTKTQADLIKKMDDPNYSGMIKLGPGGATLDPSLPGEMAYRQAAIDAQRASTGYREAQEDFLRRRDPNATKRKTSQSGWSTLGGDGETYIANDTEEFMPVSRGAFNPNDPNSAPMGLIVPDNPEAMIDVGADLSQATPTPTDYTLPNTARFQSIQPPTADLSQVDLSSLTASTSGAGIPTGPIPTEAQPFSLELSNEPAAVDLSDATLTPVQEPAAPISQPVEQAQETQPAPAAATQTEAPSPINIPTMDERIEAASAKVRARKPVSQAPNGNVIYQDENGTEFVFGGIVPDENGIPHELRGYRGVKDPVKVPLVRKQKPLSENVQKQLMEIGIIPDEYTTPREAMAAIQSAKKSRGLDGSEHAKLNEAQGKNASFAAIMLNGESQMDKIMSEGSFDPSTKTSYAQRMAARSPWTNSFSSPNARQYQNGAGTFLTGLLRKESQGAITNDEWRDYGSLYFPIADDDPATVAQKKRAREVATQATQLGLPKETVLQIGAIISSGGSEKTAIEMMKSAGADIPPEPQSLPGQNSPESPKSPAPVADPIQSIIDSPTLSRAEKIQHIKAMREGKSQPVVAEESEAVAVTPSPQPSPTAPKPKKKADPIPGSKTALRIIAPSAANAADLTAKLFQ